MSEPSNLVDFAIAAFGIAAVAAICATIASGIVNIERASKGKPKRK